MKKFKFRFTSITVAAIFIAIVVVFFVAMVIYGSGSSSLYWSSHGNSIDAIIYEDESDYLEFLEENGMTSENAENGTLQFVSGASKQLWFDEGNIWSMSGNNAGILTEYGKAKRKNVAVGITLAYSVSYRTSDNTYHIEGHLSFDDSHANIFTFLKEETMDCIAVTWGGGLRIDTNTIEASATYSNGKSAYIARNFVDFYEGICFDLEERSGNKYVEDCTFRLTLEGADEPTGELADIDVRYFHSYGTSSVNYVYYEATTDYVGEDIGRDPNTPVAQSHSANTWHADLYIMGILAY